jgi:hypothetical protein
MEENCTPQDADLKRLQENDMLRQCAAQPISTMAPIQSVCPMCGYCPTCGRKNVDIHYWPYQQYPWYGVQCGTQI